jgi:hypothetical protein
MREESRYMGPANYSVHAGVYALPDTESVI